MCFSSCTVIGTGVGFLVSDYHNNKEFHYLRSQNEYNVSYNEASNEKLKFINESEEKFYFERKLNKKIDTLKIKKSDVSKVKRPKSYKEARPFIGVGAFIDVVIFISIITTLGDVATIGYGHDDGKGEP